MRSIPREPVDSGEWDPSGRYNELRWRWRMLVLDLLLFVVHRVSTAGTTDVVGHYERRAQSLRDALGVE